MPAEPTGPVAAGLADLERQVARDLDILCWPGNAWLQPRVAPDGGGALDVLVVGAGQCGLATAFALRRERVDNIRLIDRAPAGREGPWRTYARMPTLRSLKQMTVVDLGIPSLTFRAWFEAQRGAEAWCVLHRIDRADWADYLDWYRRVLGLPVENDCRLLAVEPADGLLRCTLQRPAGRETVWARKLALCTGIEGSGGWHLPAILRDLPADRLGRAWDPALDFGRLAGRRVAVLGAGASAFDQAETALQHGAAEVHLFCRRPEVARVQPLRHLGIAGFLKHFADLPDEWRWRFMNRLMREREPPPPETWDRVVAFGNFTLHQGCGWDRVSLQDDEVLIETARGPHRTDFVIAGTGLHIDVRAMPELAGFADAIALWADRYRPPREERNDWIGGYPYLGPGFQFTEKRPGEAPFLKDIHLFTYGSWLSNGFSGGGMNGLLYAVPRLAAGLTRDLYVEDAAAQFQALLDYDKPEFELGRFAASDGAGPAS